MAIFDVIVNTDDLVVLGPPEIIELSVSIGQQGQRGSTFYAGSGSPNDPVVYESVFGSEITPIFGDVFINYATGNEYGWLYVYNPKIVGDQWDQVLKLEQPIYAKTHSVSFIGGSGTLSIPLTDILPVDFVEEDPEKYIVVSTPIFTDPVSLSINSKTISGSNLQIVFGAVKYSSATWAALNSESLNISLNITVV